nr:alpha-1,3-arabinosyltransferase XAT3-like [Ziziphus jujuba var. spinosa]
MFNKLQNLGKDRLKVEMGKECKSLVFCLLTFTLLYAAFSPSYINPFDTWKQRLSNWNGGNQNSIVDKGIEEIDGQKFLLRRLVRGEDRIRLDSTGFSCNSDFHSEVCIADKPVIVDNNEQTIYVPSTETQAKRMVQPYALKDDPTAMKYVTPVKILHGNTHLPSCDFNHNVPAVVFSSGGFTGNIFHELNELIIPLFITCRHFGSNVRFVITDFKPWWVSKYNRILSRLSRFEVLNPAENGTAHCFPGAIVGLKYHDNLALNYSEIPGGYSMFDFKHFLRETYDLKHRDVPNTEKPVLILISRPNSRRFLNEREMKEMMKELGFQIIVATPNRMSNLDKFASLVNSCSVMVGAHGAGLANSVFLPSGAVMVQVVPLGLEWASTNYFGGPATEMEVKYLEYKITAEESSLSSTYGPDDPVIKDPESIFLKGYHVARDVYVHGQNLQINVTRFRETLVEAMKLLGRYEPLK